MTTPVAPTSPPPQCSCGQPIAPNVVNCTVCGAPVGFPNVRYANRRAERSALADRLRDAKVSADARGSLDRLLEFGRAVEDSSTVICRHQGDLQAMLQGEGGLMQAYHPAVRAGLRVPTNNAFDSSRETLDSVINPTFFQNLQFGALSLDGRGVPHYGDYAITLREYYTASRTTVFEENPFTFRNDHPEMLAYGPPPGYRAVWGERDRLAMAKLQTKIESDTPQDQFATILMEQGDTEDGYTDFVECHVYGAIHPRTFKHVRAIIPDDETDRVIWSRIAKRLDYFGVTHEEEIA